jgi:hypothetical protein
MKICIVLLFLSVGKFFLKISDNSSENTGISMCKKNWNINLDSVAFRGVVKDLSDLRDRGPGCKSGSRPLTSMKAVTNFQKSNVIASKSTSYYRTKRLDLLKLNCLNIHYFPNV